MDVSGVRGRSGRPIRALQVVLSLNPGGTERLVVDIATRLHPGIPTMVCCLDTPGAWADDVRAAGIRVEALGRQAGFHPALGRRIAALAAEHGATVMHAHHYSPFVYAALARLWSPTRALIYTEHGRLSDAPPSPKRRLVNSMLFARAASRVYAVSAELGTYVGDEGFARRGVGVIYNGISIGPLPDAVTRADVRHTLGVDAATTVIGTIARLDPVKDLGTLLAAVAELHASTNVHVVIVGDGPERAHLEGEASRLGVADRVTFLGQRQDARRWLAGCDIYVNASTSEGVSLTILEAMAAALPVVVTAVGGTPEVVTPECGRLVAPRSPRDLAEAIGVLARDPAAREVAGRAGRRRVEAHFALERMVDTYRDVYVEVG